MNEVYDLLLDAENRVLLQLTMASRIGAGRLRPRLQFTFNARTIREAARLQLLWLRMDIKCQGELVGVGDLTDVGETITSFNRPVNVEAPVDHRTLRWVTAETREGDISLQLDFRGYVHYEERESEQVARVGEDVRVRAYSLPLTIPRSDWFQHVLTNVGIGRYVFMEAEIPNPPDRQRWEQALRHLDEAERFFADGSSPQVLAACYSAFEALNADPKQVFANVTDPKKKASLDDLVIETKNFLHSGRHVSKGGPVQGGFAVDHRDAAFALVMTKAWVVYTARLLA